MSPSVDVAPAPVAGLAGVAAGEALGFVVELHKRFEPRRQELLRARVERRARLRAGERPGFLDATRSVREGDWTIEPVPDALQDRRVEITGPTERKMLINALNSGARIFMADFEDANAPTWENMLAGQVNLTEAIAGTISLETEEKTYRLGESVAQLVVRPRGWHLPERHVRVDGEAVSGSLFDFGLYVGRNGTALAASGAGVRSSICRRWSHIWRRGCGMRRSALPRIASAWSAGRSGPPC